MTSARQLATLSLLGSCLVWAWRDSRQPGPQAAGAALFPPPPEVHLLAGRSAAKRRVVGRLLRGEMTLPQAAACFRRLNAEPPACPDQHFRHLPGGSDEEKLCRQVIDWATVSGTGREAARLRLERELDEHLRSHHGTVDLPAQ